MRHAEPVPLTPDVSDEARGLSDRGRLSAHHVGRWLAARDLVPDLVVTSGVRRARETTELVLEALGTKRRWRSDRVADGPAGDTSGTPPIVEERGLYAAQVPHLVKALARSEGSPVLVIGHEPVLSQFVGWASGRGEFRQQGLDPAALAVLRFDGSIEPGAAEVLHFVRGDELTE